MEYIKIENGIITDNICTQDEQEGYIEMPNGFNGVVGEPVSFYNSDYTRKTDIELYQQELKPLPIGYKLQDNQLVEMSQVEKYEAGVDTLPSTQKIVDGEIVEKTDDEKLADGTITQKEYNQNKIQENEIYLSSTDWYAIRFADTGETIPNEIKLKRQEAREKISELRLTT